MPERLRTSQLRERGWTKAMIRSLLGPPDEEAVNPVFKSKVPMALYDLERVVRVEASADFRDMANAARRRVVAGMKAAEKLRRQAIAWAQNVAVNVRRVDDLLGMAVRHYNDRGMARYLAGRGPPDWQPATTASEAGFLARIQVNYVRHVLTRYEELLDERYGRVGVDGARFIVRTRVYEAIAQAYPHLAVECRRQAEERNAREQPHGVLTTDHRGEPLDAGRCTTCGDWTALSRNTVDETGLRCVECRVRAVHRARGCTHDIDEPCRLPMGSGPRQWTLGELIGPG